MGSTIPDKATNAGGSAAPGVQPISMGERKDDVAIVIPAYNEGVIVTVVVADALEFSDHVIVVDDGSDDDTAERAYRAGATVLRHPINLGQGAAIQTGLDFASRMGVDFVATLDADGQHEAASLAPMLKILRKGECDIVLGSRFLGEAIGISTTRLVLLKVALAFSRFSTGLDITDTHNGIRAMTAVTAARLDIQQNRMAHASEILQKIKPLELGYVEVPVRVRYTEYSVAKGQSHWDSLFVIRDLVSEKFLR